MPTKRHAEPAHGTLRERRTNSVLDAAQRLFSKKGYQQTTMEAVAKNAGLSVGTLYNLFGDKEQLYAQVSIRIGQAVLERLRPLEGYQDPEQAVRDLIRLRFYHYADDRLFFQPFGFPAYLQIQPDPSRLGNEVQRHYREYIALVERIFDRWRPESARSSKDSVKMAVYIEGLLTAFMSYWSGALTVDKLPEHARQIANMLLRGLDAPEVDLPYSDVSGVEVSRALYITRYDLERLKELIKVVRTFGREEWHCHAQALEDVLLSARITNPREVPPDVVTMNTKLEIQKTETCTKQIVTLVFPNDSDARERISILDPLGTAMFGRRVGDAFLVINDDGETEYRVARILYQPEDAGDFSL